ncbi:MAG TPA: amidohydrolase family protein [Spirochaetia bacterium]|nr:amidohydrolase family protein [Spirochaetia bacterium]
MEPKELPSFLSYRPESLLKRPAHIPDGARFPVIDAHNHLFGDVPVEQMTDAMDAVGVQVFVNLTGNCSLPFDSQGYTIRRRDFDVYKKGWMDRAPGRFAGFTMSEFARWDDFTIDFSRGFTNQCVAELEADVGRGAIGLKVTKELGLRFHEPDGSMVRIDDERLYPVWQKAGELGIPVLIHTSDPVGFFLPVDPTNEHYPTLLTYPGWSFHGSHVSKEALLQQRTRMMADHPGTTFVCPHVANMPEDLQWVSELLTTLPNVSIDFSARMDELGRQPYSARDFLLRFQDRVLFGADMPVSARMYRSYFRFLETWDEYFDYPGYGGEETSFHRWKIYGLGLPDGVLEKIYRKNALRIIPGLRRIVSSSLPA